MLILMVLRSAGEFHIHYINNPASAGLNNLKFGTVFANGRSTGHFIAGFLQIANQAGPDPS